MMKRHSVLAAALLSSTVLAVTASAKLPSPQFQTPSASDSSAFAATTAFVQELISSLFSTSAQHVPSNTALGVLSPYAGAVVIRDGFSSPSDGGRAAYTYASAACAVSGGNGGPQVPASSGGCWNIDPSVALTPYVFGAKGNGTADDTTALNSLFQAALTIGKCARLPAGTYKFTTALAPLVGQAPCINGDGPQSVLEYAGTNTTANLLTLGDGTNVYAQGNVRNFRLASLTQMTGGAALYARRQDYLDVDLVFDGQRGNGYLFYGMNSEASAFVFMHRSQFRSSSDGILASNGVEIHMMNSVFVGNGSGGVAEHVAGGVGGFYTEGTTESSYASGIVVDTSVYAAANSQVFVNDDTVYDSNSGPGCQLNDSLSGADKEFFANGWFKTNSSGCNVLAWTGGTFISGTGKFGNNTGNGIYTADQTVKFTLGPAVSITNNSAYGIYSTAAITMLNDSVPVGNSAGVSVNVTSTHAATAGGVTCSGAPTSSFATNANGVVTHC